MRDYIMVNDGASIITEATTIFNGDTEERFINLRTIRKDISKAITTFINNRKVALTFTPEQCAEDMEAEWKLIDVDQERAILVMNINAWNRTAQQTLDVYNDYDRDMLESVAKYVERCRVKRKVFAS